MSPENQGVFQILKEVTFRRILAYLQLTKMGPFCEEGAMSLPKSFHLRRGMMNQPEDYCNLYEILILWGFKFV